MSQAGKLSSTPGSAGEILFLQGNTGGQVGPNGSSTVNIVGSGTISVTGNPGTNTLTISDMDAAWVSVSASTPMVSNMGYFVVSPGGAVVLTLPATSIAGDVLQVALDGATSFSIAQGAGQTIVYGNQTTTSGVGGSITSTQQGDAIRITCRVPNLRWVVTVGTQGNLTVV
jgi:hypothetical protein